ncbi:MAG: AMP-binding protein [Deltaproteobacteria bacterium]|nr:AMP-binding protein [Deltaproteobacteria bacterium]
MPTDDRVFRRTIHGALKDKVKQYGDRTFFFFKDQAYTYEDLDRESDRVAAGFQALGIGRGDKVAIFMGNRPEFLFLWFGLSKLGAVEVPINSAHRGDLLTYMVDTSDSRLLVLESRFMDRLGPVLGDLPKLEKLVVLGEESESLPEAGLPVRDFREITENGGAFEPGEVTWSDPFVIMFTSGTTGPSKGSLMPQNYALFMGEVCMETCEYTEKDVLYNTLPLFHGNAQLLSTMPALMSGARMVLAERFSASRFWPDVRKYGCTEFNYIGGILPILLKADPRPDDADNPLRVLFGGGCPPHLFDEVEKRFGVTLLEGYGMSEIGLPLLNTLKERKPGTCGKPVYGCQVKLVDDYGLEVGPGVPGELLLRNREPYTMLLEYYKMPAKTVEAWRDLWYNTGDYLVMDEDGYFNFVDRKKDALRRRGENISSQEVEKVFAGHPAVLECAAVGVKSDMSEDEVMICLSLKPGESLTPELLLDYAQERMAYFMVPRYVRIMGDLPKTPTEKVQKAALREAGVTPDTWDREAAGYQVKR